MKWSRSRFIIVSSVSMAIVMGTIFCFGTVIALDQDRLQVIWTTKVPKETEQFSDWLKSRITTKIISITGRTAANEKPQTLHMRLVMKRKGSFYLFSTEDLSANPAIHGDCHGINSKYAFWIKRSKNGKDWVLHNTVEATSDFDEKSLGNVMSFFGADGTRTDGYRNFIDMTFSKIITVLLIPNNKEIEPWKIGELPGFRLHSISAEGPRQNILRVNFDFEAVDAQRKKNGVANCVLDFDLDAKCYPVKSHQVLKIGAEETVLDWSSDLKQKSEKEYELKLVSHLKTISNSKTTRFEETEKEAILSLDDPPERDFTLSAFGLPEAPGIEWKKPFPWYLVFAGIGTVCVGVFFFLRSRAKRF